MTRESLSIKDWIGSSPAAGTAVEGVAAMSAGGAAIGTGTGTGTGTANAYNGGSGGGGGLRRKLSARFGNKLPTQGESPADGNSSKGATNKGIESTRSPRSRSTDNAPIPYLPPLMSTQPGQMSLLSPRPSIGGSTQEGGALLGAISGCATDHVARVPSDALRHRREVSNAK